MNQKKMWRRLFACMLALAMVLSCGQVDALASGTKSVQVEEITETYINPLYADVITEDDLVKPETADDDVMMANADDDEYAATIVKAGEQLRAGMKNRETTVTILYQTAEALTKENLDEIFNAAVVHTGKGTEGDYLTFQCGGWTGGASGSIKGNTYYYTITYTLTYYTDATQESEVDTAVADLVDSLDLGADSTKSDYEKIKAIYDYMCDNITYDYTNLNDDDYKLKYTAYAALINGTAVCQGFANLFYRLALEAGIDARIITGTGNGGAHAWNIVKLGDYYYNVDATWDINYKEDDDYQFFLLPDESFEDHSRDAEYETDEFNEAYPMATAEYDPSAQEEVTDSKLKVYNEDGTELLAEIEWSEDEEDGMTVADLSAVETDASICYTYYTDIAHTEDTEVWVNTNISDEDHEVTGRSISQDEVPDSVVYQVEGQHEYEGCRCINCEAWGVEFYGASLSLKGYIDMNFYVTIAEELRDDETAYVEFDIPGETVKQTIYLKDLTIGSSGMYKFTCHVTAREMNDEITATYYVTDAESGELTDVTCMTYSVAEYAEDMIEDEETESDYPGLTDLLKAMVNYGAAAQIEFNYNTENPANAFLDAEDQEVPEADFAEYQSTYEEGLTGLSYCGASLILKSSTSVRHYFALTSGTIDSYSVTAKADGADGSEVALDLISKSGTLYYVVISDISARKLGQAYTITVTDGTDTTVIENYSALSYGYGLDDDTEVTEVALVNALYAYNQAAVAYFGE